MEGVVQVNTIQHVAKISGLYSFCTVLLIINFKDSLLFPLFKVLFVSIVCVMV